MKKAEKVEKLVSDLEKTYIKALSDISDEHKEYIVACSFLVEQILKIESEEEVLLIEEYVQKLQDFILQLCKSSTGEVEKEKLANTLILEVVLNLTLKAAKDILAESKQQN